MPPVDTQQRRHSLRWRIPLIFSALLVMVLGSFLYATWHAVEGMLVEAARGRAVESAGQIADILARGVRARVTEGEALRSDPALIAFLRAPTAVSREAARARVSAPQPFRRTEIWDARGRLLLAVTTRQADSVPGPRYLPAGVAPTGEGFTELRSIEGQNYMSSVMEVRDGTAPDAPVLGYLRRFGTLSSTPDGRVQRLLGQGASLRIGTPGRGIWTDFFTVVEAPPLAGATGRADERRWIGASAPVAETPWRVWVGYPRGGVVAPAVRFMDRMLYLAALLLAACVVVVSVLGSRLTRPLRALSRAAQEVAGGDYARRVAASGPDEIGRLGEAFNVMTDRIQEALDALRRSHDRTNFALASAGIGVWEAELDSGRVNCSESMAAVLGVAPAGLPLTVDAFLGSIHAEERESVRALLQGSGDAADGLALSFRVVTPEGASRWTEGRGQRRTDAEGRTVSVLGVSVDVTQRLRLEAQLRQSQKMEAVGQLAGGVAHDFNNLLTAILGNGALLLDALPDRPDLHDEVREILHAGESAAALTRQLLAFSRRQVMHPEIVDPNTVVATSEKLLRRLIGENIRLTIALTPELDPVRVDRSHLEQVLLNLAVNARDAMPNGGTLTIATAGVELGETLTQSHASVPPGRYVVISVEDTGTGMTAETQTHLFEPFFTTKPAGKGTGLGLATVFGIVQQSGGHIYVYSEEGLGSTFKVYLPAVEGRPAPPRDGAAAPESVGGTETILVVEDSPQVRGIARRVLQRLGYRVVEAENGEEALRLVGSGSPPDLVLTDVIMPGMTGPELARELTARYPAIRVLFTSGYSGEAIARHGMRDVGDLFIEKPYSPADLATKVREAIGAGAP